MSTGPGPEASENVVGPVKKGPGPVNISLNYYNLLPPRPVGKKSQFRTLGGYNKNRTTCLEVPSVTPNGRSPRTSEDVGRIGAG